jgi:hypothetical protein
MAGIHLLTQAYGSSEIRAEALYCAWSSLAWADGAPLVFHVFTDEPEAFAPLAGHLAIELITPERIRAWRGPQDFVHRVKPEIIREIAARFPDEQLLYVDADAFFTGPLARVLGRIGPGRSVMHTREYPVASHTSPQITKFRRDLASVTFRGAAIDLSFDMWNAGVLGLDPAQFDGLGEWLEFIDEVYPRCSRFLVEQLAISRILQRDSRLAAVDDVVFHYWFQRNDHRVAIRRALDVLATLPFEQSLEHLRANPIRLVYRRQHSPLIARMRRIWTGQR